MATSYRDDNLNQEVFQRRFQKRILDKFTNVEDSLKDAPNSTLLDKPEEKKSPFNLNNILILGISLAVLYFTEFTQVIIYDQKIYKFWFWTGIFLMTIHLSILCFLALYCNVMKKIGPSEWEKQYPKAIPLATFSVVFGFLSLTIAHWPVWGLFSPLIFSLIFLAVVIIISMFG